MGLDPGAARCDDCQRDDALWSNQRHSRLQLSRNFTGLQAHEIHLCGDASVLSVVQALCGEMGDPLVVHKYERFSPLTVEELVRDDWLMVGQRVVNVDHHRVNRP